MSALAFSLCLSSGVVASLLVAQTRGVERCDDEREAILVLRRLAAAQEQYLRLRPTRGEPSFGSLAQLGAVGLLDAQLASGAQGAYRFEVLVAPDAPATHWAARAVPLEPRADARHLAIDASGTIYARHGGPVPLEDALTGR